MSGRTIGNLILMTLICVVIFWVFMALRPARAAEDFDWGKPMAATEPYGECYLDVRVRTDDKGQHLDVHASCSDYSDDTVLRFTGLNNPQDGSPKKRVCPRAPNIEEVERIDRAAFMVYVRCVEKEAPRTGLVLKLEGDPAHLQQPELLMRESSDMVTTEDFLQFWTKAIPNLHVHPDDAAELERNHHALALDTLVGPFMGPVRTAPVVLLTLNPGFSTGEAREAAQIPAARESMANNLGGDAPLPAWVGNPSGREWTTRRLRQFGLGYEDAEARIAFINLIPYRSREGAKDMRMADRLESSRMVRAWARDTLFPEAVAGERVVVCLRSAKQWGLVPDTKRGAALFAPKVTRGAFMEHVPMREEIGVAVRRAVGIIPRKETVQ